MLRVCVNLSILVFFNVCKRRFYRSVPEVGFKLLLILRVMNKVTKDIQGEVPQSKLHTVEVK